MTIFNLLKADHKIVAVLLKKIEKIDESHPAQRNSLFKKLKMEFYAHATAEEKAVYTPLKTKEDVSKIILEAYEEHSLVEHLFDQLTDLEPGKSTWTAKMTVLAELVKHHVTEEEGSLFKKMKSICNSDELTQMASDFLAFKNETIKFNSKKKLENQQQQTLAQ